ncbi:hypothetical protein PV356_30775 [Streptomyces sp. WI03-5b]|uniref:hypothetical protein n=1 Tax=Streptomyces sp. WI03-5b TaxID=462946 RepID=UPI0029AFBC2E|nr:hypothetical protein [Streptomyces sp. WI03-5b]MDX2623844.1 hypothetical protein [Streptomyces sp. WI03-5b]
MSSDLEHGTCSACRGALVGNPSGAWWHEGTPCGRPGATFQPREQDAPPHDRQIKEPRRNR